MNTAQQVIDKINAWKEQGLTKSQFVTNVAKACLGWPYVWGGYGQICNPTNRKSYAERSSCPAAESAVIISKCQVLRGSSGSCSGCQWYPGGTTRFFDCRGFTRWCLSQVGIDLQGAGATSQWNDNTNWVKKGEIKDLPDQVCCVFMKDGDKMSHTGLYLGGNVIIHCSGTVKYGTPSDRGWSHWAVPRGLDGDVPVWRPTIRKGSSGDDVKYCQQLLMKLGYDLSPYNDDGKFGNKTLAAVKAFQKSQNLVQDGVVGPMTWDALINAAPSGTQKKFTVTLRGVTQQDVNTLREFYPDLTIKEE